MQVTLEYGGRTIALETRLDLVALYDPRLAASSTTSAASRISFRDDLRGLLAEPVSAVDGVRPAFAAAGYELGRPKIDSASVSALATKDVRQVFRTERGKTLIDSGRLVARARPGDDEAAYFARLHLDRLVPRRKLHVGGIVWECERLDRDPDFARLRALQTSGHYAYIEPSFLENLGPRCDPNKPCFGGDPLLLEPWHLTNIGCCEGVAGADVGAAAAWIHTSGKRSDGSRVRIAVIDNGFDLTHPDLDGKWLNGGYFTADNLFVPLAAGQMPVARHGSECAGMILASGKKIGLAPDAQVIPIASMADQVGTQATLADALVAAAFPSEFENGRDDVTEGAEVISCSLGPDDGQWELSGTLGDAIERVTRDGRDGDGTVVVWATSNSPFDIALDKVASDERVLAVGRSSRRDEDDGSARGEELDLLAPGVSVVVTTTGPDPYRAATGTSYAAPLAAAACGLVLAMSPALARSDVHAQITGSCKKIGGVAAGHHPHFGHGRLDAGKSLS